MGYDANMGRVGRGRGGNYYQPYGEWNGKWTAPGVSMKYVYDIDADTIT